MAASSSKMLEVELKFPLINAEEIHTKFEHMGAVWTATITQIDSYFAHPSRDFAATDEALRLRSVGEQNCITYKGPKLDLTTKTRREIEIPYAAGANSHEQFVALLEAVGFRRVGEVRKQRQCGSLVWEGTEVTLALDDVAGLGRFVEIELIAEQEQLDSAKKRLQSLAAALQLGESERRGYLDMLLRKQGLR